VAVYAIGTVLAYALILILARYSSILERDGRLGSIRYIAGRTALYLLLPSIVLVLLALLFSSQLIRFLGITWPLPLLVMALALLVTWQLAILRGLLQGMQRFGALSLNLSIELVFRVTGLVVALLIGLKVGGAMAAVLGGVMVASVVGAYSLKDVIMSKPVPAPLRTMVGFSILAALGTLGIFLLYNTDTILAGVVLKDPTGVKVGTVSGYYGALNKIGTIIYFLTMSVGQVLFPKVIEAVAKDEHPGHLLAKSAGIVGLLGVGAIVVFGVLPGLIVGSLFGHDYSPIIPDVLPIGVAGLALSLDNLLIQFSIAVKDRVFIPILGLGVVIQCVAIFAFHHTFGSIVYDVLLSQLAILVVLTIRCAILLPALSPAAALDLTPAEVPTSIIVEP
ncbi:MAG TPA: oligosaccharide flippase family protein, partial [Candidatus Dormibacteraeota bacterium]|nr:oligosaccharide flippase family protein [Candidatus Dormibacteraeota bacterium]